VLKVIAFDLWETLITDTPEVARAQERMRLARMEEILLANDHVAEAHRIEQAYRTVWQRCHELYWSADNDIPCRRQIEVFLEELGIDGTRLEPATLDELEHAYATAAVTILPAVVTGAYEVLSGVKKLGLRTGLISNTGRTPGYALREILKELELAPSLDAMVFSDEHGACKPRPSIFEQLRTLLGADYNEMLFIGDNLYVDILGAKRCGMRAVHFVPPVRGTAVAPAVEHEEVEADATVSRLGDLLSIIKGMRDEG
jgi:HAD superfamily hydrolase (TIGR01509 family)